MSAKSWCNVCRAYTLHCGHVKFEFELPDLSQPEQIKMKLVYIAGPFTDKTTWAIEQNVRRAEQLALQVALLGAMPVCPHTNTRFFHGYQTAEFWYEGTMEMMRRCDAVIFVEGWANSKGSVLEGHEAKRLGMPVFYRLDDLDQWLKS